MISVKNLHFSYTKELFIEDINFEVKEGEILGFLGPSGAGKSTLQKILTGLITHYSGEVAVNGEKPGKHSAAFYEDIGVDFEFPSLYEKLTAKENLQFFSSLYQKHRDISVLLDSVGLAKDADKKVSDFSKGMKSRLNFVKALVHDPSLLFLDEPTSGLDPSNSRIMKDLILQEKNMGKTIILTTHNMYDATELCDRVAFIVDGKIIVLDTPHHLIMSKGSSRLVYTYKENGLEKTSETPIQQTAQDALLIQLIQNNKLQSIHSGEPTLNDIFVELTGRKLQ